MGITTSACCMKNQKRYLSKDTIKIEEDVVSLNNVPLMNKHCQKLSQRSNGKHNNNYLKEPNQQDKDMTGNDTSFLNSSSEHTSNNPNQLIQDSPHTNVHKHSHININKHKESFINAKPNNLRRKSISISMNQFHNKKDNQHNNAISNKKNRSMSLIGLGLGIQNEKLSRIDDKAFKELPMWNFKKKSRNNFLDFTTSNTNSSFNKRTSVSLNKTYSIVSENETNVTINSMTSIKKRKQPIEEINEPFTEKQINLLKKILFQEDLISLDMDDCTVNTIINSITYIRVKAGVTIFTRNNTNDNIYYIIEKGKLEYQIDSEIYELSKYSGIGTRALVKNSKDSCTLKASERCYLFCLPIDKYQAIAQDFMDKQLEEKKEILKTNFFFKSLSSDVIESLANLSNIITYSSRIPIIQEDNFCKFFYIIIEGHVVCTKGEVVVKRLIEGCLFGEICLFNQIESFYAYTAEKNTTMLRLSHEDFIDILGDNAVRTVIFGIFENSIKESEELSKIFFKEYHQRLFNAFQLKFYFNDTIQTPNQRKVLMLISGTAFKSKYQIKDLHNLYQKVYLHIKNSIPRGKASIESILKVNNNYSILGDECVIFEGDWDEIIKAIPRSNISLRINILKNHPLFKNISDYKLYRLVESMHCESYVSGKVILKDGPNSDKFYLIKSGQVQIQISKVVVKTLEKHQSFGDISSHAGEYSRKADFVSNGKVECFILEKETYEEIIENDNQVLEPLKQLLVMNELTLSLDNLFFIKELGCGAYGKVFLVHDQKKFYAMKTAEIQAMAEKKEMAQLYINEKTIMSSLSHPFVVPLHNTFKTREYIFFLMEFVDGDSLRDLIKNKKKGDLRKLYEVQFYGAILFNVLNYLQKNKIIHRDLKPDNILINKTGYLKVIDFGVATRLINKDSTSTFVGSSYYMSPEIILGKNYNFSVDYWAVGIILYEIFYGRVPFGFDLKEPKQIYKEITDKKPVLPSDPNHMHFNALIQLLLNKNPNKRIMNFHKIKTLSFFEGFDWEGLFKMRIKPPYIPEQKTNEKDLFNQNLKFINFMRNNIYSSSNDLEDLMKNGAHDYFNDF